MGPRGDGETGILVRPGDPGALRAALKRRIAEQFSWQRATAATLAAYEEALVRR